MLLIATLILLGAWIVFWPWIRQFLESRMIPTVRDLFGERAAGWMADFTGWLDDRTTAIRRFSKEAWSFFRHRVLRIQSRYTQLTASTAEKRTESWYHTDSGKVIREIATESVSWDQLPPNIRSEMIRLNRKECVMDDRDALLAKARDQAAQEGIAVEVSG